MAKLPFGKFKETGELVGIDEVERGLNCNCICPSCQMILEARKGDEREHHFKHHSTKTKDGSKVKCDYSYWVSVRSMAKQLIEKNRGLKVKTSHKLISNLPYQNKNFIIKNVIINSRHHKYKFDLELHSSIGTIYIYFLTDESNDEGRYRTHFYERNKYFLEDLILEINLTDMKNNSKTARVFLEKLLFETISNKNFLIPCCLFLRQKKIKRVSKPKKTIQAKKSSKNISNNDFTKFQQDILTSSNNKKSFNQKIYSSAESSIRVLLKIKENKNSDDMYVCFEEMVSFYKTAREIANSRRDYYYYANQFDVIYRKTDEQENGFFKLIFGFCQGAYYGLVEISIFNHNRGDEETFILFEVKDDELIIIDYVRTEKEVPLRLMERENALI